MSLGIKKQKVFEKIIGYRFKNKSLLEQSLVRKAYGVENDLPHNERMEFLGDSILGNIIAILLFSNYDNYSENEMSSLKSYLVSHKFFAKLALKIQLDDFISLNKGEANYDIKSSSKILCNIFESLFCAIFLDSNFQTTKKVFENLFYKELDTVAKKRMVFEPKLKLQQYSLKRFHTLPDYRLLSLDQVGSEPVHEVSVYVDDELVGSGRGRSIKDAEQSAADAAFKQISSKKKK